MSEFSNEDDAFASIIKDALPDKIITNFVLIAEIYDDDGEELTVFMSDKMTPWLALGMLKSATQTVTSQSRSQFSGDD